MSWTLSEKRPPPQIYNMLLYSMCIMEIIFLMETNREAALLKHTNKV